MLLAIPIECLHPNHEYSLDRRLVSRIADLLDPFFRLFALVGYYLKVQVFVAPRNPFVQIAERSNDCVGILFGKGEQLPIRGPRCRDLEGLAGRQPLKQQADVRRTLEPTGGLPVAGASVPASCRARLPGRRRFFLEFR